MSIRAICMCVDMCPSQKENAMKYLGKEDDALAYTSEDGVITYFATWDERAPLVEKAAPVLVRSTHRKAYVVSRSNG